MLIIFHVIVTPLWYYIAAKNPFTKEILDYGWAPVICAMLISRYLHILQFENACNCRIQKSTLVA